MKRIFPMYKGVSLDKAGMGYSSIQSAKHYMDEKPVRKDFDVSLPKNYWYVPSHRAKEYLLRWALDCALSTLSGCASEAPRYPFFL